MSGTRPEILFPLFADITTLRGVGPGLARMLARIDITRPRDLLLTLPTGGVERRVVDRIREAQPGQTVVLAVTVLRHVAPRKKGGALRITVTDGDIDFDLVWFRGGAQIAARLPEGARRVVTGKAELYEGRPQIVHPDQIEAEEDRDRISLFAPLYPLTAGLPNWRMVNAVRGALERAPDPDEWIDPGLVARNGWPSWRAGLALAHDPSTVADTARTSLPRARLAYDEVFAHQVTLAIARTRRRIAAGRETQGDGRLRAAVLGSLPYEPTGAQTRAAAEIAQDMAAPRRMSRLLQADVGSGKTLVVLLALLAAVEAGGQGVLMAPTEVLARQHAAALRQIAAPAQVVIEVLTGRTTGAERTQLLSALAGGAVDILIGTHAVFQDAVVFSDLRLAVVDEQHRFGVRQRYALGKKGQATDVLVMTATPIPRSLAMSNYGDMDLSVLDEKPPGRQPVRTALVSADRRDTVVAHLKSALAEGRQAYWVCPLVNESEARPMAAAEARATDLRTALGEGIVGLVHGQMPAEQRDAAMRAFARGETRILVATTVIEVGIDVPNASIMVIEQAEGFGLAQLHQLRGRVGRGTAASTCVMLYQPPLSDAAARRLALMRETEDGFRIAEEDLAMRGAGDPIGLAQSGLPRFRIADPVGQADLMATAQADARLLLERDPDLTTARGICVRTLLWLMEQDEALRLIRAG